MTFPHLTTSQKRKKKKKKKEDMRDDRTLSLSYFPIYTSNEEVSSSLLTQSIPWFMLCYAMLCTLCKYKYEYGRYP
jgi:hypothetical protein